MRVPIIIRWLSFATLCLLGAILIPHFAKDVTLPGISAPQITLGAASPETISAVAIQKSSGEQLELLKQGDSWLVNSVPAQSEPVTTLLSALSSIKVESIAAQNEATFASLGISSSSGQLVSFTTSAGTQSITVGKSGTALNTFYVKAADKPAVYLVTSPLRNLLDLTPTDYVATSSASPAAELQ
ncbi:DUF4340 domain-containing protein [Candidatus Woesebacteria bacterium]|nr:DUF4340 domain-containing protein [Candidatus Woesebacteria bacterium]